MGSIHWKEEFLHRDGEHLMPKHLPVEVLIYVARSLAKYKDGVLDRFEMEGVWGLLTFWTEKLLNAQNPDRLRLFQTHPSKLLPELTDELDLWVRMELVSRQIGYPVYDVTLATLFNTHFHESSMQ